MTKKFKNSLGPLRNTQPDEQIDQDKFYQIPGVHSTNGTGTRAGIHPTNGSGFLQETYSTNGNGVRPEGYPINGNGTRPGSYPTNGSLQFKAPLTPFPNAPETSVPNSPSIWMPGTQPANIDPRFQEQVKYYADWLAKKAKYEVLNDNSKEIDDYIEEATKVVKVDEKEVAMFAPFRPKLSALQTFTTGQVVALCIIGLLWVIGLLIFRLEMLTAIIAAITVMLYPQPDAEREYGNQVIPLFTRRTHQR